MEKGWRGLPYKTIADHYRHLFSEKVYKIPVSVVDNCPNRMGLKGMQTCIFCDEWGSAARAESFEMSLRQQIEKYQDHIGRRFNAKTFLVYFQAYTNSFAKVATLRDHFSTAMSYAGIKGLVIGTRPDCLSPAVLNLWQEFHEKSFVSVELGIQSFDDEDLNFLRRGHTRSQALDAILRISSQTEVDLGIHLIFGLPEETDQKIIETACLVNTLPITNVKLHNLHVLKGTPLADLYQQGLFKPIERDRYAHRVQLFLQHLRPDIALHRLAAFASRWDELIAPSWTSDKMGTHQFLIEHLRHQKAFQAQKFQAVTDEHQLLRNNLAQRIHPIPAESKN